jgi:predicted ATPase
MLREFCDWVEMLTAERPLLLVLDDLQLADEATVELISALARRRGAAKLLLAGTYRPEDACLTDGLLETVKRDLVLRRLAEEIELELLTQEETVEYAARSSLHTVTEATHRFLFRYSEGNPRFLSALIEELLSDNPDLTDLSTATTTDCISTFPLRIPNGIRKQFETRIAQVSSPGRRAIEAACIFGSSVITSHAAEVARLDPEMFEDLCEPMIAGGVIGREGCDRLPNGALTQRYRFRHLLYREILYGMLPLERRSRLHQRAAVYIEALYAGRLEEGSIATLHTV